jgi:predicted DNA-binding transcriptional regulator AlpA
MEFEMATKKPARLVGKDEILVRTNVSFPTIWMWMRAGKFPRAREVNGRPMWLESEVSAWIEDRPPGPLQGPRGRRGHPPERRGRKTVRRKREPGHMQGGFHWQCGPGSDGGKRDHRFGLQGKSPGTDVLGFKERMARGSNGRTCCRFGFEGGAPGATNTEGPSQTEDWKTRT